MEFARRGFPARAGAKGRALIAGLLLIGAACQLRSEEPLRRLTLADALDLAETRGYDFLLADAAYRGAEGDLMAAKRLANPVVSGAWLHSTGVPAGDTTVSASGYSLSVTDQAAIEGVLTGKRSLRVRAAEAAVEAAKANRDDALRVLKREVAQAFYAVLAAEAAVTVDRSVAGSLAETLALMEIRYKYGAVSEVEVARVETAKLEAEQAVAAAVAQVAQARASLAFLAGGIPADFEASGSLEGPAETWPEAPERELVNQALALRADVQAACATLDRADAALALARRQRIPDVALQAGYVREGPEVSPVTPPTVSVGAALELPLFNQRQGEIARAESDRLSARIAYDRTAGQAASEVISARAAFFAAREQAGRMTGRLLERARTARDLVRHQYREGAISLIDLLDAERTALSVELEYAQDLYALRAATAQLAAAAGLSVTP